MSKTKPFCVRCLIRDTCDADKLKIIDSYKASIDTSKRCSESEYEKRLALCKDCKWLNQGTCLKSGYLVEARAYNEYNHCPISNSIW